MLLKFLRPTPGLPVRPAAPLGEPPRFGMGAPADLLVETSDPQAFVAAIRACRGASVPFYIIGDGSNLVVSDNGYRGVVLRFAARNLSADTTRIFADAGASLQELVDFSIAQGLA